MLWILGGKEVVVHSPEEGPEGESGVEYLRCPEKAFLYVCFFNDSGEEGEVDFIHKI